MLILTISLNYFQFVDLDHDLDRDWSTTNPDYRPLGRKRGITIDRADFW